jgi:Signal transduction histidine kinase
MSENIIYIITSIIIVGLIITIFYLRKRMIDIVISIETILTKIENRQGLKETDFLHDTLTSKLSLKIQRIYEMLDKESNDNQEKHQQIQMLISDIAHQVKTPITNIKMINETLDMNTLSADKENELKLLLTKQVDKLDNLINSMLKASRLETGAIEMDIRTQPIFTTLSLALNNIILPIENKKLGLEILCDQNLITKHDQKWTAEALFNILDNAVKYNHENGKIKIICEQWEFYTKIAIIDTGIGISEIDYPQVFKRFYRGTHSQNVDGCGIGLYLARSIIERQGGYIKIKSTVNIGTEFAIFLPNN